MRIWYVVTIILWLFIASLAFGLMDNNKKDNVIVEGCLPMRVAPPSITLKEITKIIKEVRECQLRTY